jgi:hypothetical protein
MATACGNGNRRRYPATWRRSQTPHSPRSIERDISASPNEAPSPRPARPPLSDPSPGIDPARWARSTGEQIAFPTAVRNAPPSLSRTLSSSSDTPMERPNRHCLAYNGWFSLDSILSFSSAKQLLGYCCCPCSSGCCRRTRVRSSTRSALKWTSTGTSSFVRLYRPVSTTTEALPSSFSATR